MDPPPRPRALVWMSLAALAAIAIVAAVGAWMGVGRTGAEAALRLTARLMFVFFWPSYVGGALVILFGDRLSPVKRRARALGLAFASVLTVHLAVVAWLCGIGHAPGAATFAIFGAGAMWTALLALASIPRLGRALPRRAWWILGNVGMTYIALAFALDFVRPLDRPGFLHAAAYVPFATLALLAPAIRILAWVKGLEAADAAVARRGS